MDWMKIAAAALLIMMIIFIWPRAKLMMSETRKAEPGEWQSAILPILAVVGFVILLILMV